MEAPPKIVSSPGDPGPLLIRGSVSPPESTPQNGISIGSSVFAGRPLCLKTDRLTDRHTHRPRYIRSNWPHLCTLTVGAMRHKNNTDSVIILIKS